MLSQLREHFKTIDPVLSGQPLTVLRISLALSHYQNRPVRNCYPHFLMQNLWFTELK